MLATKFGAVRSSDGRSYRVDGRPEYVRQACEASLAPPRHRRDRPLLPAPRRPRDADRGDGRRHGAPGRGGQGTVPRALRVLGGDASACVRGASHQRAPERVLDLHARRGGRDPARVPRARRRLRGLQPARAWAPGGARTSRSRPRRATCAPFFRASAARISNAISRSWTRSHGGPREHGLSPAQLALAWLARGRPGRGADSGHQAAAPPGRERRRRGGPGRFRRGRRDPRSRFRATRSRARATRATSWRASACDRPQERTRHGEPERRDDAVLPLVHARGRLVLEGGDGTRAGAGGGRLHRRLASAGLQGNRGAERRRLRRLRHVRPRRVRAEGVGADEVRDARGVPGRGGSAPAGGAPRLRRRRLEPPHGWRLGRARARHSVSAG